MKRIHLEEESFSPSKRHCDYPSFSVTATYNYLVDNCLSDYLNKYGDKEIPPSIQQDSSFFKERGILFESEVIKYLSTRYPVKSLSSQFSDENLEISKAHLLQNHPFLHSVCLKRKIHGCIVYGVADLIVKGKYILELSPETSQFLSVNPEKYYVIDIKFSTLPLASNGMNILNTEKFKAYKTQVWLYSKMLKPILGYVPHCGFLMGRRWKYLKCGTGHHGFRCDERLGVIDFSEELVQDSYASLDWLKQLKIEGEDWEYDPPSIPELYPNIYAQDKWGKYQSQLAEKNSDLLLLWNCTRRHREIGHSKSIHSFQDPDCSAKTLGITGKTEIIDSMIRLNKRDCEIPFVYLIEPDLSFQTKHTILYVDFETLLDVEIGELPISPETKMIAIIGIGYEIENEWKYRSFVATRFGIEEEKQIMFEFSSFVQSFPNPILLHWTQAEVREWRQAQNRVNVTFPPLHFLDLHKLFIDSRIVIKNAFKYSLKDVCRALNTLKIIDFEWNSDCADGLAAAIALFKYYIQHMGEIDDIIKYNEYDCLALKKILKFVNNLS